MRIELTKQEAEELKIMIEKSDENKHLLSVYNKLNDVKGFGAYLTQLRLRMGLSQREFGIKVGISHSEVSRLEQGKRINPNILTLKAISDNTGEGIEELIKHIMGE